MTEAEIIATHADEFRRCLVDLDVVGIRKLWRHVSPHLPQPSSDYEALVTLHLARTKTPTLPLALRTYSEAWLKERLVGVVAHSVGIAVGVPVSRKNMGAAVQEAMSDSVERSIKAGVDIDLDAPEVKKRMLIARDKESAHWTK